jgi:hypothetical protein
MSADRSAAASGPAPFLSPSGSVRLATCGWCWAATGQPCCVTTRHGAPAARPEELAAALARIDVIAADVVILDGGPVSGPDEASGQLGTGPVAGGQR